MFKHNQAEYSNVFCQWELHSTYVQCNWSKQTVQIFPISFFQRSFTFGLIIIERWFSHDFQCDWILFWAIAQCCTKFSLIHRCFFPFTHTMILFAKIFKYLYEITYARTISSKIYSFKFNRTQFEMVLKIFRMLKQLRVE